MLLGIDHVVIAVPNLEIAIANYNELGFTVVPGGRHPIGSSNALIAFADSSYMELIAFDPGAVHPWADSVQKGGGLVDFCLQTDNLEADVAAFRKAGVKMGDPAPLSRKRPDGFEVSWVLSIPMDHRGAVPFLIRDVTPREERLPRQSSHRNGVRGIADLTIAVDDLAFVRLCYSAVAGASCSEVTRNELKALGVGLSIGPHVFEFLKPESAASPLAQFLSERGQGPYAAALKASGKPQPLDPSKTLNARLSLV